MLFSRKSIKITKSARYLGFMEGLHYFHYRNSNQALEKVKSHVEQRVRKHLMKRHKVKDRGIGEGRFPSADLYGRYGLYKMPTKAGWKSAHA
jgi:RNA-directed DNA polymerase